MQPDELARTVLGGQASPWGGLALIGTGEEVSDLQLQMLSELNRELVKIFLLGGSQDHLLLRSFEVLELNPVRTEVLPEVCGEICAAAFRETLAFLGLERGTLPAVLMVGRQLGGHGPALLRRVPELGQGGVTTVADVSLELSMPLPGAFRQFVVFDGQMNRFERAVERWHRHDAVKPVYQTEHTGAGWVYVKASMPQMMWRGLRQ